MVEHRGLRTIARELIEAYDNGPYDQSGQDHPVGALIEQLRFEVDRLVQADHDAERVRAERKSIGGWAFPTVNARKAHYFPANEERSLCGSYALFDDHLRPEAAPQQYIASRDDCAPCQRKVRADIDKYYPDGEV